MPLLDLPALTALHKKPPRRCNLCRNAVRPNYCRECDEYFEAGHMPVGGICTENHAHDAHRTY